MKKNELGVPLPKRYGWKLALGAFVVMGTVGVVLSLLYRDMPKRSDIIAREKTKNAKHVVYAIVFSKVDPTVVDSVIQAVKAEIGTDTAYTDYVIGSTLVDPWCASLGEYERMLRKAMTETRDVDAGRQTMIVSMVTGLLVKSKLPASLFFIGTLHPNEKIDHIKRTRESVNGLEIRNSVIGPVKTFFYLRPFADATNKTYTDQFLHHSFSVSIR